MHTLGVLLLLMWLGPIVLPVVYGAPHLPVTSVIGQSARERPIVAYTWGNGNARMVVVGGIHGGYEGNTVRLVERAVDHFSNRSHPVPPGVSLTLIPSINPDGVAGDSRFNANVVDLNRNWDHAWTRWAFWGSQRVSAGTHPFSEPETLALSDFLVSRDFSAALFFHSAEGAIYPGACSGPLVSMPFARLLSQATGYRLDTDGWDYYPLTGQAIDYLDCRGIPAVDIELTDHQDIEWERNRRGLDAVLTMLAAG